MNTYDRAVKKRFRHELILTLKQHTDLGRTLFYPKVHSILPELIDASMQEPQEARQLIEQIKGTDLTHPQCEQLFQRLGDAVLHHIDTEEQQLFPKLEKSGIDLKALGLEM
jgi:hemerythrin superfamily protein